MLLSTLGAAVLTVAPVAAQQEVPDTRGRVCTLIGGVFGDGPFISAGAGAGIRLIPHLGLDLELLHLSGVGGPDRADVAYFSTGILEGAIPFFGVGAFDRPRRDVTTFLTRLLPSATARIRSKVGLDSQNVPQRIIGPSLGDLPCEVRFEHHAVLQERYF